MLLPLLVLLAMLSAARCYPPGTRVVVFVQGIYTSYDAGGTSGTLLEEHRFDTLKAAFKAKGYTQSSLLDFSYAGGTVAANGAWQPAAYPCEITDRTAEQNLAVLEAMLGDYRKKHPNVHFTLVGHSLGGYLSFLEGAREAGRPDSAKLGVDTIVAIEAPLKGVSADKKAIFDLIPCDKTYAAGGELVTQKADPLTPDIRRYQSAVMANAGVRLATFGNTLDCLYNTAVCVGGGWVDDSGTQFLDGQASTSRAYAVHSEPLASHDAILADGTVAKDTVAFVGAP